MDPAPPPLPQPLLPPPPPRPGAGSSARPGPDGPLLPPPPPAPATLPAQPAGFAGGGDGGATAGAAWITYAVPRPVPTVAGAGVLAGLAATTGVVALVLAIVAAWALGTLADLAPPLVVDGSASTPGVLAWLVILLVAVVVAGVAYGVRLLARGAVGAGAGSIGAYLGEGGSGEPGLRVAPARRTALVAAVAGIAGAVLAVVGMGLYAAGDTAAAVAAGGWCILAGAALALVAAALVPALLRAVHRRVAVPVRIAEGPGVAVPGPRSSVLLPVLAVVLLAVVAIPVARDDGEGLAWSCGAESGWRCDTLVVPADHERPAPRGASTRIGYAIHPADEPSGERRVLVLAVGGPGSPGIPEGGWMLRSLGERVSDRFDVVIYDPRGTGTSDPVDCPSAARAWFESTDAVSAVGAEAFTDDCLDEAGVREDDLARYASRQVAGDIEAIRRALGVERIALYGVSYGTVVAQAYAAAYPDRVEALVLDAPLDRAQPAVETWALAAKGFERTLLQTLAACEGDSNCRQDLPDARDAWRRLLDRLDRQGPITDRIRFAEGRMREVTMTRTDLGAIVGWAMYDDSSRMLFLRALAAWDRGDPTVLLRLLVTLEGYDDDSTFAYFATWCADGRGSPGERTDDLAGYRDVARRAGVTDPMFRSIADTIVPCLSWPHQPEPSAPAESTTVPTLILTATSDPITTVEEARAILARHPEARLVETRGGDHGTAGSECPAAHVERFLADGELPALRTSTCMGEVIEWFWPLAPSPARTADDAMSGLYWELFASPEVMAWSGTDELVVPCASGGTATYAPLDGWESRVTLEACAMVADALFTGSGTLDFGDFDASLDVMGPRGSLELSATDQAWRLTGTWDRVPVSIDD